MSATITPMASLPVSALTAAAAAAPADCMLALQADTTQNPPQQVPRLVSLQQMIAAMIGTGAGQVVAGNDPRLVDNLQIDATGSLAVPGQALSLGGGLMSMSIDGSGHLTLRASGLTVLIPLPTADPGSLGAWWNNGGYVCISTGATS